MHMYNLDDLDKRLLSELRVDGRATVAQLARRLEVTRTTVTKRIERLTAEGVILGFTVRTSSDVDPQAIRAICQIALNGGKLDGVVRALRGMPEVTGLHSTNGEWDLVVELTVASLPDVDKVLSLLRQLEGVARSETSLLLRSVMW